jgi:hypothetical protein
MQWQLQQLDQLAQVAAPRGGDGRLERGGVVPRCGDVRVGVLVAAPGPEQVSQQSADALALDHLADHGVVTAGRG